LVCQIVKIRNQSHCKQNEAAGVISRQQPNTPGFPIKTFGNDTPEIIRHFRSITPSRLLRRHPFPKKWAGETAPRSFKFLTIKLAN
jgi:hypothetical protein